MRYAMTFRALFGLALVLFVAGKPQADPIPPSTIQVREETEHFSNDPERHNLQFDHEAFLGSETAKEYSQLTREESRNKLKDIIRKIDNDKDGFVNEDELKDWIIFVANSSTKKITDRYWKEVNVDNKDALPWNEFSERTHGNEQDRMKDTATVDQYLKSVKHDRRRWEAADVNKDGMLNKEEFHTFLHPDDKPQMRYVVIQELLESVDKDGDGFVSEQEYIDDMARAYGFEQKPGEAEPEWMVREREQFKNYRDMDKDGRMNQEEVGEWISPKSYDPAEAEVQHLFYHVDVDKDGKLTEEEILDHQDLFVSSQATNYGSVFNEHSEL